MKYEFIDMTFSLYKNHTGKDILDLKLSVSNLLYTGIGFRTTILWFLNIYLNDMNKPLMRLMTSTYKP